MSRPLAIGRHPAGHGTPWSRQRLALRAACPRPPNAYKLPGFPAAGTVREDGNR